MPYANLHCCNMFFFALGYFLAVKSSIVHINPNLGSVSALTFSGTKQEVHSSHTRHCCEVPKISKEIPNTHNSNVTLRIPSKPLRIPTSSSTLGSSFVCCLGTEDYFCVRPCQRPSNAPSRLSPDCDPRTFHCRKGTRVFDEEGAPYCTGACVENSLQSVSVGVMDNAHSFTPCVCAMRGSEGKVCQTLQNVVVLHCEDGYVLRVSTK